MKKVYIAFNVCDCMRNNDYYEYLSAAFDSPEKAVEFTRSTPLSPTHKGALRYWAVREVEVK